MYVWALAVLVCLSRADTALREQCLDHEAMLNYDCHAAISSPDTTLGRGLQPCFCVQDVCGNYSMAAVAQTCESGFVHALRCGACIGCAKDMGEPCGGPADHLGFCREQLVCQESSSIGPGRCVKQSPASRVTQVVRPSWALSSLMSSCRALQQQQPQELAPVKRLDTEAMDHGQAPIQAKEANEEAALRLASLQSAFDKKQPADAQVQRNKVPFWLVKGAVVQHINHLLLGTAIRRPETRLQEAAFIKTRPQFSLGRMVAGNAALFPLFQNRAPPSAVPELPGGGPQDASVVTAAKTHDQAPSFRKAQTERNLDVEERQMGHTWDVIDGVQVALPAQYFQLAL